MGYGKKNLRKKTWQKPNLTILIRTGSVLELLASCKSDRSLGIAGPAATLFGCFSSERHSSLPQFPRGYCERYSYRPQIFYCCETCNILNQS